MSTTLLSLKPGDPSTENKSKSRRKPVRGNDFGEEGTNKTISVPKPDSKDNNELRHTPKGEKSPYRRG